ncbi:hypothetical protein Tco_1028501 [Tanacetum coccineum]|uniref:Uncharacterized protein n=1 Tax=Tanacetum coccineum TaxID=301880 RepID=A0ABQ5G0R4_9ASTR
MKAILHCNLEVPVDNQKPPNTLLQLKRFPEAKSLELEVDSKENNLQNTYLSPPLRHPNPNLAIQRRKLSLVQQAAGGLTSLRDTSEDGAHPQLSSDKTKYARDGLKTAHTTSSANEESGADDISQKVKLEDLSDILKDTRSAFFTPDSPTDEPIIVLEESEEEENAKNDKDIEDTSTPPPSLKLAQIQELTAQVHLLQSKKDELEQAKVKAEAEVALMKAKPSYLDINQLTKLLVTSLKPDLSKLLTSHDFASCLPTKLKELPSKITELSGEIKELKQHIKDMEIELPGDLKEILSKLETFTSTISIQEKLKTLDSLLGLLNKVTNTLNRFATLVGNASGATAMGVPSADKATTSPAEGEKDVDTNLKNELVDSWGIDIVTQYYNKKLLYEKYYEKMKKKSTKLQDYQQ